MTARRSIARSTVALLAGALLATTGAPATHAQTAAATSAIIAGSTAPAGSWPSIAHIESHYTSGTSSFVSRCTGSVIAPHWVVTAGHCTFGNTMALSASQMTVYTGRLDLDQTATGQTLSVAEIIRHPGYSSDTLGNDVALLHLQSATSAPPIRVATQDAVASYSSPAGVPNTAGWGWTTPGTTGTGSRTLNETYVPLRANADCVTALAAVGTFEPSNMVCAGASGPATTTCHGDSGGPLIVFAGNVPVLWGITSWGDARCAEGIGASARVAAFESFLAPALAELGGSPAPVQPTPAPVPARVPAPAQPTPQAPVPTVAHPAPGDTLAPALSHFRIPAKVVVRRGRPTRPITVQLHSSEQATLRITLLRKSGRLLRAQPRLYQVRVGRGTSRMTLPRSLWRMTSGSYRLRIEATDSSGNGRAVQASIRARLR